MHAVSMTMSLKAFIRTLYNVHAFSYGCLRECNFNEYAISCYILCVYGSLYNQTSFLFALCANMKEDAFKILGSLFSFSGLALPTYMCMRVKY